MGSPKAKRLALNGILGALAVICLLLANILPTNRISLYALSSFFVSISIMENGIKAGWIFYAATCLISFIVLPDKLGVIPYVVFFGLYGIVKFYIERLNRLALEYILKFVYFNANAAISIAGFSGLFMPELSVALPIWLLVIAAEVVFFIYDYVYTLFIDYYRNKLMRKFR
ncbi:MAG: hypothetical protein GX279_08925 [Clostridiaceae bacterium]|nr:hypothetical protein [Clostridiaceae bacterium]